MVVYDLRLRKPKIGCSSKMRVSSKMGGGVLRRWKVLRRWVVSDLCASKIEEHPSLIFDVRTPEVAAPIFVPRNRRSWSPPIFVLRPRRSKNPSYLHSPEPAIEEFPHPRSSERRLGRRSPSAPWCDLRIDLQGRKSGCKSKLQENFPDMPRMKKAYRNKKASAHWSATRNEERPSSR